MPYLIPTTAEDFALRCAVLLIAIGIDWLVGEPAILWRRLPHPVVLFGRAIVFFDKKWMVVLDCFKGSANFWATTY